MSIDGYVATLRARLPIPQTQASDLSEEVRGHLEDAARDLQMAGLDPRESEREAIRRFGTPDEIAAAVVYARRAERRHARTRSARLLGAVLAAAIVLAALSGNVASAYTSGSHGGTRPAVTALHGHNHLPALTLTKGQR